MFSLCVVVLDRCVQSLLCLQDAVSKLQSVEEQLEMLKDIQKQLSGLGNEVRMCTISVNLMMMKSFTVV